MKATQRWFCPVCENLRNSEWEAEECCPKEIDEVWICGECEEEFDTKSEADECCGGDSLDSAEGWNKHIATLEQAGQLRIPLGEESNK